MSEFMRVLGFVVAATSLYLESSCASVKALPTTESAQTGYEIWSEREGLHFVAAQGSKIKSTIVEFENFIALIEVALSDEGANATVLTDDVVQGERMLHALQQRFPNKPLQYVMSTHWHPHSISAIRPFIESGATFVTTKSNFERIKEMLAGWSPPPERMKFVDQAAFQLKDKSNEIVAHRLVRTEYPAIPTDDFLFFSLPRYQAVMCACMYNKWEGPLVQGRELITRREIDLQRYLEKEIAGATALIRVNREKGGTSQFRSTGELGDIVKNGVKGSALSSRYEGLRTDELRARRTELLTELLHDNIPTTVINSLAANCFEKGELERGLEFAVLQVLLSPGDANAWDTLGEAYFFLGHVDAARNCERNSKRLDATFRGGEAAWVKERAGYQRQ